MNPPTWKYYPQMAQITQMKDAAPMHRPGISGHFPSAQSAQSADNKCLWNGPLFSALLISFISLFVASASARAGDNWSDARHLFLTSRFRESAIVLEREAQASPRSPAVWFNLGQARFQAGDVGLARIAWERASVLSPRDPDIRGALELARGKSQSPEEPAWAAALRWLSAEEWAILLLSSTAFVAATFCVGKSVSNAVRGIRVVAVLVQAGCATLWIGSIVATRVGPDTVVVARDVTLMQSPVPQSKSIRGLPEGLAFRAGRVHGDWVEALENGRGVGWVGKTTVARFRE